MKKLFYPKFVRRLLKLENCLLWKKKLFFTTVPKLFPRFLLLFLFSVILAFHIYSWLYFLLFFFKVMQKDKRKTATLVVMADH